MNKEDEKDFLRLRRVYRPLAVRRLYHRTNAGFIEERWNGVGYNQEEEGSSSYLATYMQNARGLASYGTDGWRQSATRKTPWRWIYDIGLLEWCGQDVKGAALMTGQRQTDMIRGEPHGHNQPRDKYKKKKKMGVVRRSRFVDTRCVD